MGVLDKIKNALFEVEYVEVEEPQKKEKKPKFKEKKVEKHEEDEKPIAKKVVLPGKREEKVEELFEEELKNDNFESRPIDESIKENRREDFKIMDDDDFKVDSEPSNGESETASQGVESSVRKKLRREDYASSRYEEQEYVPPKEEKREEVYSKPKSDNLYSSSHESKPYGVDSSYNVPVHEYGTYEKKEEKTYFKPSPIISPIYGILDKNYKKEDVVQKKDIRLTTNYTRSNVSVDDVRNKAYGDNAIKEEVEEEIVNTKFEVEEEEDENLLVDLSDRAKPEVKELTMGDALEYFQDLGLEYNVDYVDVSKQKSTQVSHEEIVNVETKVVEEVVGKPIIHTHVEPVLEDDIQDVMEENSFEKPTLTSTIEIVDESKDDTKDTETLDDDDNLFDLIDSMYQESE